MNIAFHTGMDLPELEADRPLPNLVSAVIRKRRGGSDATVAATRAHWPAEFFGLDRVSLFVAAAPEQKHAILERCSHGLIEEAFFIEKAGVAFAAKMVLLAETIDERKLYAMFASDEATHLDRIAPFYTDRSAEPAANPFLAFLSKLVDGHYRAMLNACTCASLRDVFTDILADEAAHHGSGILLLADGRVARASREPIVHAMARFLSMVQAGPQSVVDAVQSVLGPLSRKHRIQLFEELDAEHHAEARLDNLRRLMCKAAGAADIAEELDRAGYFRPHTIPEMI
jgi:hypothetical protein